MDYKNIIAETTAQVLPGNQNELKALISPPPNREMGDYALPCFTFAKTLKKSPAKIASEAVEQIKLPQGLKQVKAIGPYINFFVDPEIFVENVIHQIREQNEKFGHVNDGEQKVIAIDFSSPNLGKELAFHHLRGTVLGNSLSRIHTACNYKVVRINHLGDWGTSYGKLLVMYLRENPDAANSPVSELTNQKLNQLYRSFAVESLKDPHLENQAREAFQKLEAGDPLMKKLWAAFRDASLKELKNVYNQLGVEFDAYTGESFFIPHVDSLLQKLNEKGLSSQSQGAQIVDLSNDDLPPLLLKKQDGATLYATRDLCAVLYRKDTYNFHKCLYVVDNGQALHFKQVFRTLELMGEEIQNQCEHIPYGLILTKSAEGKWEKGKTRAGGVSLLKEVLERASAQILEVIEEKNADLKNKHTIAEKIASGALIFNGLKTKRLNDIRFDWDSVLSFDGDSGPYVQNAYVRLSSIIRKSGKTIFGENLDVSKLTDSKTQGLLHLMKALPEKVRQSQQAYEPSVICQYLLELSDATHGFLHSHRVLGGESELELLELVHCLRTVFRNAMGMIGMPVVEEM